MSEEESSDGVERVVMINPEYVRAMVASIVKDQDLSRYILRVFSRVGYGRAKESA